MFDPASDLGIVFYRKIPNLTSNEYLKIHVISGVATVALVVLALPGTIGAAVYIYVPISTD